MRRVAHGRLGMKRGAGSPIQKSQCEAGVPRGMMTTRKLGAPTRTRLGILNPNGGGEKQKARRANMICGRRDTGPRVNARCGQSEHGSEHEMIIECGLTNAGKVGTQLITTTGQNGAEMIGIRMNGRNVVCLRKKRSTRKRNALSSDQEALLRVWIPKSEQLLSKSAHESCQPADRASLLARKRRSNC